MIEFINVNKTAGERRILRNVNLVINPREITVICGPSGAGKSTLLRAMNALESIDSGTILINGKDLKNLKGKEFQKHAKIGMLFQNLNLYTHLTIRENVMLAPRLVNKLPWKEAESLTILLLEQMGINGRLDDYPISLSTGEQQRVALARCLAMKPEILLLDEPTSAIDVELVTEVLNIIKKLNEDDKSIIVITHEMAFAYQVAHKVIFMDNGTVIESGTPEEIIKEPKELKTKQFMNNILSFSISKNSAT